MDWSKILNIVELVLLGVGAFIVSYFKTSAICRGFAAQLIADAEKKWKEERGAGMQKFAWVITQIYAIIPGPLKPFFNEIKIREFVQTVFNEISEYAAIQCDRAVLALKTKYEAAKKKR